MHYYQHHIGDFIRDTSRLTDQQCMTYLRLIWMYYESEKPLPDNAASLALRVGSDEQTVSLILSAFFTRSDGNWIQMRCESEIRKFQKKADSARHANDARWSKTDTKTDLKSDVKSDANQVSEQIPTNNQQPITNNQFIHTSADKLPTCPQDQIVSLYHKHLPELPSVRLMTDKRKKAIRKFWEFVLTSKRTDGERRATDEQTALDWIDAFFLRARDNDFLMGRIPRIGSHANWQADLEFLLSEKGISHVIEKTREAA